jgi:hypothetical protein
MYRATKGGTDFRSFEAFDAIVTTPIMVAVWSAFVIADGPDEKDGQGLPGWMFEKYRDFMLGTMVGIRDLAGALRGFSPDAGHGALVEAPAAATELYEQIRDDTKGTAGDLSTGLKLAASVAPIPGSGTLTRLLDYVESYEGGGEDVIENPADLAREGYQAVVEGKDRDK